jgi:hypothetical protein
MACTQLAACVARQPDATLDELRVHLAACSGPVVGRTTVWQGLQALNLRRKKERPRRRARHQTCEAAAPHLSRSAVGQKRGLVQVRGRKVHEAFGPGLT